MEQRDERNKQNYQTLYRILVRMFFTDQEEIAPALIDYMVYNAKCSMSLEEMKEVFKLNEKKIKKAFQAMEGEIITFKQNRWTLSTNVKEYALDRIKAIKSHIEKSMTVQNVKLFYCRNCPDIRDITEFQRISKEYDFKCKKCGTRLEKQVESHELLKKKLDLLDTIEEMAKKCEEKNFPTLKLFPQEYYSKYMTEDAPDEPVVVVNKNEPYKEVLKKINDKRKAEGIKEIPEVNEKVFERHKDLVDWFKSHPTAVEKKVIMPSDILKKRKLAESGLIELKLTHQNSKKLHKN